MKCSYQSGYKFDQASLQIESGRETGRSVPEQGGCACPARTTPGQSFKKVREMINNLIGSAPSSSLVPPPSLCSLLPVRPSP